MWYKIWGDHVYIAEMLIIREVRFMRALIWRLKFVVCKDLVLFADGRFVLSKGLFESNRLNDDQKYIYR